MNSLSEAPAIEWGDKTLCLPEAHHLKYFLLQQGTFDFPALSNGLFPAARVHAQSEYTGYGNVWVRDNIFIALAHWVDGQPAAAARCMNSLARYFQAHLHRFERIIRGESDPRDPMNRPHVRFNGRTLSELPEKWAHAQNDALGYFLWLRCRLHLDRIAPLLGEDWRLLGVIAEYLQTIRYWQDEDSGHWEEARKVQASSIGAVVAGLRELRLSMKMSGLSALTSFKGELAASEIEDLRRSGEEALARILPWECIQTDPAQRREADAALLFLIYPLNVLSDECADQVLRNVEEKLIGEKGIRRYLGDSFWCADYKNWQLPDLRTADFSDNMAMRDQLLKPGEEAQWCIFDPALSVIYGRRYAASRDPEDLQRQLRFFNRSLSQLTDQDSGFPPFRCPELYYLEEEERRPNDVTPLLWTQANLLMAFAQLAISGAIA